MDADAHYFRSLLIGIAFQGAQLQDGACWFAQCFDCLFHLSQHALMFPIVFRITVKRRSGKFPFIGLLHLQVFQMVETCMMDCCIRLICHFTCKCGRLTLMQLPCFLKHFRHDIVSGYAISQERDGIAHHSWIHVCKEFFKVFVVRLVLHLFLYICLSLR